MSIIQRNSDLLLKLINDIIGVSTLESENVEFKYQEWMSLNLQPYCFRFNFADSSENHFPFRFLSGGYVAKVEVQ